MEFYEKAVSVFLDELFDYAWVICLGDGGHYACEVGIMGCDALGGLHEQVGGADPGHRPGNNSLPLLGEFLDPGVGQLLEWSGHVNRLIFIDKLLERGLEIRALDQVVLEGASVRLLLSFKSRLKKKRTPRCRDRIPDKAEFCHCCFS